MSNEIIHFKNITNIPKSDLLLPEKEAKELQENILVSSGGCQTMTTIKDVSISYAHSSITSEIEKLLQEFKRGSNLFDRLATNLKKPLPELSLLSEGVPLHLNNNIMNASLTPEQKNFIVTVNQQLKIIFENIKLLEKILDNIFARQLINNSLMNILNGINNDMFSENGRKVIKNCFLAMLTKLNGLDKAENFSHAELFVVQECVYKTNNIPMSTYSSDSTVSDSIKTDIEFCTKIADLMTGLDTDYLGIYENAVSAMTRYWKDFSNQIQGNLATWTHAHKEDIYFNIDAFQKTLQRFYNCTFDPVTHTYSYYYCHDYILYPPQPTPPPETPVGVSIEEAMKWCSAFGLQPIQPDYQTRTISPIIEEPPGSDLYVVIPDPKIIMQLSDSTGALKYDNKGKEKKYENNYQGYKISTAEYQAWQTSFNTEVENMKTDVQILTSRYSTANSTYDLVIKLLSSTITALFDSAKGYLNF